VEEAPGSPNFRDEVAVPRLRRAFLTFCRRILERHVVHWTLAYLAGAWIALEATSYLVAEYDWPPAIVPLLTVGLAFGTLFAITIAWCHGQAGWQRLTRREIGVYLVLGTATLMGLWAAVPRAGEAKPDGPYAMHPLTRVAVLYTKDHRAGPVERDLAADLTESLTHHLAQVPALQMLPLQAVAPFRVSPLPLDSLVAQLRAGVLVESSLTEFDDSVRLTVQLIEAETGEHMGSWTFDRPLHPTSRLIRELPADAAREIRRRIGRRVRELEMEASTTSPEALVLYRRAARVAHEEAMPAARTDWRSGLALLAQADSMVADAEAHDPDWTEAMLLRAGIADLRSQLPGGAGTRYLPALEDAIGHANRAIAAAPGSAAALERRAHLLFDLARNSEPARAVELYRQAEADMRAAVRQDWMRPEAWATLSRLEARRGNFAAAYQQAEQAYAADSFGEHTEAIIERLVTAARGLGRLDQAMAWCDTGRAIDPTSQAVLQQRLLTLASLPGPEPADVAWAWAVADSLAERGHAARHHEWLAYGHMLVGTVLAGTGQRDTAVAVMDRASTAMRRGTPRMQAAAAQFEAYGRLRLGDRQDTFRLLEEYARLLPAEADYLAVHVWFRSLRRDPAFQRICCSTTETAAAP
jgi:TolB-like protein